jgi:hypothetical protein
MHSLFESKNGCYDKNNIGVIIIATGSKSMCTHGLSFDKRSECDSFFCVCVFEIDISFKFSLEFFGFFFSFSGLETSGYDGYRLTRNTCQKF